MSSSRPTMSAYRSTTSKHSSDGSGEDNSGHLLGLNYPKTKTVIDHNSDPAYILASLAALPPFPSPIPQQPALASSPSPSSAPANQPSLVPLPASLNPPLAAAVPDACPPLLFSLLSSASTRLVSSHLAEARTLLDDAALLLASPQVWDGLTEANWKQRVADDRRQRDEWDEYERRSITAADIKEPQRPGKLHIADSEALPSTAEEDGAEKEAGEKTSNGEATGATDSLTSAAAATPSQPADIPTLSPITQLVFNVYFPLCYAQLAQAEGNEHDALLLHWKAWLAHEHYVAEQERGQEEERRRGEEAQRRARGVSAAEDDDSNDDAGTSPGGTSASSATPARIHAYTIHPLTFPSPLSAAVLYCLGLSALHLRSWQAGLRAFGVALRVQCMTVERSSSEFVDVASTMHNIAVCLGCAGEGGGGGGWAAAWQWMKASEELMAARLPATHPRLLQLRANLAAIMPLRASLQTDAMRAMMNGMDEAKRQKDAEAELLRAAKAKKGAKKGAADQPAPGSSAAAAQLSAVKKSDWPIIDGFGADGNWFQQPAAEEGKEAVVAAAGEGGAATARKDEQVWLRRWTVETTPYEKMLVDSKKAAGGAADGKKAKAGKGAKKGKAK